MEQILSIRSAWLSGMNSFNDLGYSDLQVNSFGDQLAFYKLLIILETKFHRFVFLV